MNRRSLLQLFSVGSLLALVRPLTAKASDVPVLERDPHWHVIRWRPNTCQCVLQFGVDDRDDAQIKTKVPLEPITLCAQHKGASNPFMAAVMDNRRANGCPECDLALGFTDQRGHFA